MTPSPVGMRCPECSSQTTKVRTLAAAGGEPRATIALIVICVLAYLAEGNFGVSGGSGALFRDGALFGPLVADGEWWRLITYGFLHAGLLHIGFNMFLLWLLGRELEPQLGTPRFLGIYFSSLLAGAFGALLLSPNAATVGASGAIFGLMGAAAAILYARGVNPFQTDIGMLILFNLGLGFFVSERVDRRAHRRPRRRRRSAAWRSPPVSAAGARGSAGPASPASPSPRSIGAELAARTSGLA